MTYLAVTMTHMYLAFLWERWNPLNSAANCPSVGWRGRNGVGKAGQLLILLFYCPRRLHIFCIVCPKTQEACVTYTCSIHPCITRTYACTVYFESAVYHPVATAQVVEHRQLKSTRGPRFNPGWLPVFPSSLTIFPSPSSCTCMWTTLEAATISCV